MDAVKCVAAVFLALLLGGVAWALTHMRKIKRELIEDEAMPQPGPRANFLILLCAVLLGLSGLLIAFLLS